MIVILGNGGHAKVCGEVVYCQHPNEDVFYEEFDINTGIRPDMRARYVIGVGDLTLRRELFTRFSRVGMGMIGIRHPSAVLPTFQRYIDFCANRCIQIMAGAIIQPGCKIGVNVIINTGAQIDHDCVIGSHSHIAPGAILCGGVTVGKGAFIGAGAVIPEGRKIPDNAFVPAGTVFK